MILITKIDIHEVDIRAKTSKNNIRKLFPQYCFNVKLSNYGIKSITKHYLFDIVISYFDIKKILPEQFMILFLYVLALISTSQISILDINSKVSTRVFGNKLLSICRWKQSSSLVF